MSERYRWERNKVDKCDVYDGCDWIARVWDGPTAEKIVTALNAQEERLEAKRQRARWERGYIMLRKLGVLK